MFYPHSRAHTTTHWISPLNGTHKYKLKWIGNRVYVLLLYVLFFISFSFIVLIRFTRRSRCRRHFGAPLHSSSFSSFNFNNNINFSISIAAVLITSCSSNKNRGSGNQQLLCSVLMLWTFKWFSNHIVDVEGVFLVVLFRHRNSPENSESKSNSKIISETLLKFEQKKQQQHLVLCWFFFHAIRANQVVSFFRQ